MNKDCSVASDELKDFIEEQVSSAVEDLREQNDELRAELTQQQEEIETLREENETLSEQIADLEHQNQDFEGWREAVSTWKEWVNCSVSEMEERIENISVASESDFVAETRRDPTERLPIEQIAILPEAMAKEQLDTTQSRNLFRARFLWKGIREYSRTVGRGENRMLRITSAEMMRVLSAAEDGNNGIESKTTERVMKKIVEFTKGLAEIKITQDNQRALYIPEDWETQRERVLTSQHGDADAVVSEGN